MRKKEGGGLKRKKKVKDAFVIKKEKEEEAVNSLTYAGAADFHFISSHLPNGFHLSLRPSQFIYSSISLSRKRRRVISIRRKKERESNIVREKIENHWTRVRKNCGSQQKEQDRRNNSPSPGERKRERASEPGVR